MTADRLRSALDRLERDDSYGARLAVANALDAMTAGEAGLVPLRVSILRDITVEPLIPALRAELARSGFLAQIELGDFDTISRDALGLSSGLDLVSADLILVIRWLEQTAPDLATRFVTLAPEASAEAATNVAARIEAEISALRARSRAPILVTTFPLPDLTTLGILDAQRPAGHRWTIEQLNREIGRIARLMPDVLVVDLARLVGRIGSRNAIDERGWQTSRSPLATPLIISLAAEYATFVRAFTGRVRKCLALDCDGTLWGGILGEDGPTGIDLDPSYPGSAYLSFQREILNLQARGVLLALVSKNDEAEVLDVVRQHAHMQLRERHFAAWRINWQEKAANLVEIAAELNIGLDSLVFVDDSEFECENVRQRLPEVGVLHLGSDPSRFASRLSEAAFFDSLAFSADDRARGEMYVAERDRKTAARTAPSYEDYLASLKMEARIEPPEPGAVARVAQLTQKTNQFNLTTVRYTEGDIARRLADPGSDVYALHLRDRFSDLGLVGVAIVGYQDDAAAIDTLLLSCRVLGRGVEDALLARIAGDAARRGARRLRGTYRRTAKNAQSAPFFADRGFVTAGADADETRWELDLEEGLPVAPPWIRIGGTETDGVNGS